MGKFSFRHLLRKKERYSHNQIGPFKFPPRQEEDRAESVRVELVDGPFSVRRLDSSPANRWAKFSPSRLGTNTLTVAAPGRPDQITQIVTRGNAQTVDIQSPAITGRMSRLVMTPDNRIEAALTVPPGTDIVIDTTMDKTQELRGSIVYLNIE